MAEVDPLGIMYADLHGTYRDRKGEPPKQVVRNYMLGKAVWPILISFASLDPPVYFVHFPSTRLHITSFLLNSCKVSLSYALPPFSCYFFLSLLTVRKHGKALNLCDILFKEVYSLAGFNNIKGKVK